MLRIGSGAERKYKEFIEAGIEDKGIWKDVKGQSILGSEVADHLKLYYTTISRIVNDK
jgi:hypothetical protein